MPEKDEEVKDFNRKLDDIGDTVKETQKLALKIDEKLRGDYDRKGMITEHEELKDKVTANKDNIDEILNSISKGKTWIILKLLAGITFLTLLVLNLLK